MPLAFPAKQTGDALIYDEQILRSGAENASSRPLPLLCVTFLAGHPGWRPCAWKGALAEFYIVVFGLEGVGSQTASTLNIVCWISNAWFECSGNPNPAQILAFISTIDLSLKSAGILSARYMLPEAAALGC